MPRAARVLLAVVFALLILGVVGSMAAAIALGAQPTPRELDAQVPAWVSATLRVPLAPRTTVVRALERGHDGEYDPVTDVVSLSPQSARATPLGVFVRLHESLHRADTIEGCYREEEAIVDALARDLAPAAVWRFLRVPLLGQVQTVYDQRGPGGEPSVGDVRAASAVATGGSWRARAARLWRRSLWSQGCAGRAAMLEAANAAGWR